MSEANAWVLAPSLADPVSVCSPCMYLRYCCNVGPFHVKAAMGPSVGLAEDANLQRWVLGRERVLVRAVERRHLAGPIGPLECWNLRDVSIGNSYLPMVRLLQLNHARHRGKRARVRV